MAVSRGSIAFWVGCVRIHGRRQPVTKHIGSLSQPVDLQWICPTRPFSSASWALAPTDSLRNQTIKQPILSHPFHRASWPQRVAYHEEEWEESLSMCVLVRPNESSGVHTLVEIPLFGQTKLGELLAPGFHKSSEFSFLLTTVDGSRVDDISVSSFKRSSKHPLERQHGCFRSLFEAERCPAPFMCGSQFYCFHSPGTQPMAHSRHNPRQDFGLERNKMEELPRLHPNSLCSREARTEGSHREGDSEGEQKLAIAYERLRSELPNFFRKNHDYTMYSNDIEFINGLLNTKTRGRVVYQLTLSLWRLMCLLYFADARLEVLKLTKHMEDGTIKARWRVRGLPFLTLMLRFYRKDKSHLYRSYDAFSTFYIGHDGLVHCHKVEKVMPAQPPVLPRVTSLLASALVALGVEENRPALNLLPLLLSSLRQVRD
ncbi:uncharacterized protein C6orf136 homolog isoform X1 [Phyllopteryx taeniolatus]|uniref:uncharacterized protein C6orf136 homolog isoform X1 n=2 Tax=Phyllopteryx taeniolatus TaxID=161469 RepID=UPI002AD29582|nr:uncharacterized protein C6orf136 homolog isoform X1 [Phyllopteryx taeniolatus]